MLVIDPIPGDESRLMQKAIYKPHDINYTRKPTAILMLHLGARISDVTRTLCYTRSSVARWISWSRVGCWRAEISTRRSCPPLVIWAYLHTVMWAGKTISWRLWLPAFTRSTEGLAIKIDEKFQTGTVRRWLSPLPRDLCGAGQLQLRVSVSRIKIKRWRQYIKHWANAIHLLLRKLMPFLEWHDTNTAQGENRSGTETIVSY